jgi:hypothetical protein
MRDRWTQAAIAASTVLLGLLAASGPIGTAMASTSTPEVGITAPAPITAGDTGVSPDIPLQMCQASGTGCTRDSHNLNTRGNFVVTGMEITGPAENMRFVYNGHHLRLNGISYPEGTLKFTGHRNLCIGTKSPGTDPNLYTRHCSGDTGIIWLHGRINRADGWINRVWTLSALNGFGDYEVIEGFDPGARVIGMLVVEYNSQHGGFVRYQFR